MNYLERDAVLIRGCLPESTSVADRADGLFRIYAVLLRTKSETTQASDVHDAWPAWMTGIDPEHQSVVPFAELGHGPRRGNPMGSAAPGVASLGVCAVEIKQIHLEDVFGTAPCPIHSPVSTWH